MELAERSTRTETVLFSGIALKDFLGAASAEYSCITRMSRDRVSRCCSAAVRASEAVVEEVAFGRNARLTDPIAREEFSPTIVPRFGTAYENPVRAWWLDPADLLAITREADTARPGRARLDPPAPGLAPARARVRARTGR